MKAGKPLAFVVLAFLIGGAASQLPFAFADSSSNPLQAIWDAISALSNRQEDLQAQIDELRATIQKDQIESESTEVPLSEPSIRIELEGGDLPSTTVIYLIASNSGPDNAVGVKVTLFYEMPIFDIESMSGEQCENLSRGIIQCYIGTIGPDEEYPITVIAEAKVLGENSNVVADISSITSDTDPSNNHADLEFVTGELENGVLDSEPIPTEVESEENSTEEQPEVEESSTDSEEIIDEQSSIEGNATQDQEIEDNTNSTQSSESEQSDDQSVNEEQEQGSEDESSGEQSSEETNENNADDTTEQESQSDSSSETNNEAQEEDAQSDESDTGDSSEGEESGQSSESDESSQ